MAIRRNMMKCLRLLEGATTGSAGPYLRGYLRRFGTRFHQKCVPLYNQYEASLYETVSAAVSVPSERISEIEMECEREVVDQIRTFLEKPATIDIAFARLLYMACRLLAPDHVVETGVWYGVSSAVVLAALKKNSNGSLISIDFPPLDPSARVEIGSAVSPELRQRWQLHIGPSSQLLPKLLKGFGQIQMFIHDSEHSYRNMLTEYSYAWEYLSPGGILISDDVHKSDAFLEFAWKVNHKPRVITKTPKGGYIGILVK